MFWSWALASGRAPEDPKPQSPSSRARPTLPASAAVRAASGGANGGGGPCGSCLGLLGPVELRFGRFGGLDPTFLSMIFVSCDGLRRRMCL